MIDRWVVVFRRLPLSSGGMLSRSGIRQSACMCEYILTFTALYFKLLFDFHLKGQGVFGLFDLGENVYSQLETLDLCVILYA